MPQLKYVDTGNFAVLWKDLGFLWCHARESELHLTRDDIHDVLVGILSQKCNICQITMSQYLMASP